MTLPTKMLLSFVAGLVLLFAFGGTPASADEPILVVSPSTITTGSPGDEITIATRDVPGEYVGATCTVDVVGTNGESVHPNNDLIVSSATSGTVSDFESVAFGVTDTSFTLTLDSTLKVVLRLGPDGASSAGLTVTVSCPPIDTTTVPVTVITVPPSTIPPIPPSPECPEGEYPQGYGPDVPCGPEDPCIDIDPETGKGTTLWTIQECYVTTTTTPVVTTVPPSVPPTLPDTGPAETRMAYTLLIGLVSVAAGAGILKLARR